MTEPRPRGLERLGRAAARRRWWVIAAWLVAFFGLGVASASVGSVYRDVFAIPGTDAQLAIDLLEQRFPAANLPTAQVVLHLPSGAIPETVVAETVTALGKLDEVKAVEPPQVATDDRTVLIEVVYTSQSNDLPSDGIAQLDTATAQARSAGVSVDYGGPVADALLASKQQGANADAIGLFVALVILMFVLGTVVAALIPVVTALMGLLVAAGLLTVAATVFTVGTVAPIIGTMIGLGVGIDYSLLVVSRFRQNRDEGMDVQQAIGVAIGTAGSAVLFAGCSVVIAVGGLWFARIPYVSVLGFSAALFVAVMVVAALTLLPALLSALSTRIERLRVVPRRATLPDPARNFWYRWGHGIARHAWLCMIGSLALLLLLAAPALGLRLGFATDGDDPTSFTQRRAYDLVADAFGPGTNGPLLVAMRLPKPTPATEGAELAAAEKLMAAVKATPGVVSVEGPIPNRELDAAVAIVVPKAAPNAQATKDLVRTLRAEVIPKATAGTVLAGDVYVGGQTAELIDVTDRIGSRLVWCIGFVVLAAFLLLMLVFRSVLVPLKAAVMNLLSIGAAYGVIVVVFQWGWARGLLGIHEAVPIVAFVPLIMFAILFGLSMDYEVFLLSRVREEYLATGDNREAVAIGLAKTARVITSAAVVMISVFLVFVTSGSPTVKMLGVGLAAAVAIDATIVRLLLVPAAMELMGKGNWWLPRWLGRVLPHLDVDVPPPSVPTASPLSSALASADRDSRGLVTPEHPEGSERS
ncbi:MAG: MMPL family transporter [Actinobacteria bacterium]|nr:MMPL family transporter [Actinomycetota bacterium]